MCKWKKDGEHIFPYSIKTDKNDIISGNIILNPRMLIIQRYLLLKVQVKTGRVLKAWLAKEGKDENTHASESL
jgi:hypothetical protein